MTKRSQKAIDYVQPDADDMGVPAAAWAAIEYAMGLPWKGLLGPTPRDTTRAVFKALTEQGYEVVLIDRPGFRREDLDA